MSVFQLNSTPQQASFVGHVCTIANDRFTQEGDVDFDDAEMLDMSPASIQSSNPSLSLGNQPGPMVKKCRKISRSSGAVRAGGVSARASHSFPTPSSIQPRLSIEAFPPSKVTKNHLSTILDDC